MIPKPGSSWIRGIRRLFSRFDIVSVIVRYGVETIDDIEIRRMDKIHRELSVAVQVAISDL